MTHELGSRIEANLAHMAESLTRIEASLMLVHQARWRLFRNYRLLGQAQRLIAGVDELGAVNRILLLRVSVEDK